jgi:hypothetical protein
VVEPRSPESLPQLLREAVVLAEDDAVENRSAITGQPAGDGALQLPAEGIRHPAEPTAATHDAPASDAKHDVDAVPPEPRTLVEAVLRPVRLDELSETLQEPALRRRAPARKLEQHGFPNPELAEPDDDRTHTNVVAPTLRRAGHDGTGLCSQTDM